mmetsp:Transcript_14614/g.17060  ORF Transcript_14614/g.17060 Transcript_14614/m.17060 type:complete len:642 (-) Transcript_14614:161-2086(-)
MAQPSNQQTNIPGAAQKSNERQWKEYHEKLRQYQLQQQEYYRRQQQWQQYQHQQMQWQQWHQYNMQQSQTAAFQAQMRSSYKNVHPPTSRLGGVHSSSVNPVAPQPPPLPSQPSAGVATQPNSVHVTQQPVTRNEKNMQGTHTARTKQSVQYKKKAQVPDRSPKTKPNNTSSNKNGFPAALQRYVEESLKACVDNEAKRKLVEFKIKQIIESALAGNYMWERDWDKEPLPLGLKRVVTGNASPNSSFSPVSGIKPHPATNASGEYTSKRQKKKFLKAGKKISREEMEMRTKRMKRFHDNGSKGQSKIAVRWDPYRAMKERQGVKQAMEAAEYFGTKLDLSKFTIKGTCQDLEKPYLRLTSAPDASSVRPVHILHKSLANVMRKWASRGEKNSSVNYLWACEQLKSIRQDLTIQHVRNDFTCKVYETHARIALEQEDLKEFNQCQTKLVELYQKYGSKKCHREFAAYRIFYQIYTKYKYNQPSSEMAVLLASLTKEQRESRVVKHALKVYAAVDQGDYCSFFRLYKTVENMGVYLLELLVDYVRHCALQRIFRSYRPTIPLQNIHDNLLYDGRVKGESAKEWKAFVRMKGLHVLKDGKPFTSKKLHKRMTNVVVDTKLSWGAVNGTFLWKVLDGDNVQRSDQ